jgi:hypothetical protein
VINLFSSIQFVGVERLEPFNDDSPKLIGGTANMRAKLKLPRIKIFNIKLRWITPIVYMRMGNRGIGRVTRNDIVALTYARFRRSIALCSDAYN